MKKFLPILLLILSTGFLSCKKEAKETALSVPFEKYTLANGLTVILHEDKSDPIAAVAIYYHVGSSRETTGKTGFAHLFEHMMFQRSENIGDKQFVQNIMGAGGTFNGSTNQDVTNYFETVPKNALEMVLWMESDRMGYLENTVTPSNLANQQNVVQNEKRQSYDNNPYGYNQTIIAKNLYPKGHPYSWTVIGEMEDLTNATVNDVRAFHKRFYTPNNATLVVSGDFNKEEIRYLIEKYFGEIPSGEPVEKRNPMPVTLTETKRLYHEDNFARAPQLNMVFPGPEQFSKDSYALDFLGQLLANSKKAPLYVILVKEKKLTSRVMAMNRSQELAGSFVISVTANPGVNLTDVEKAIFEGFAKFEKDGFTEEDLTRIKAEQETRFYSSFTSVLGKAFQLASYNTFTGNPEFYKTDLANMKAVTMNDIKNAYNKYIKGKNFIETCFVPKGETNLIAEGAVNAGIVEEDVTKAAEIKNVAQGSEEIVKTATKLDRSVQPAIGPEPKITLPPVWQSSLGDGVKIFGITQKELPLVQYSIVIDGGHMLDNAGKAGVANLVATMMTEGTKNKTPEQLEDAIGLLGATIRVSADNEDLTVNVNTLSRNFEKTLALVEEMILEPRWDEEQFNLAKSRVINTLKRNEASPDFLAGSTLNKLMFGDNILATDVMGTESSVSSITLDDLKDYYNKYMSPSVSKFLIAGDVDLLRVQTALAGLSQKWQAKDVTIPEVKLPAPPAKSQLYFVDVPGAKQSVIAIGCFTAPRNSNDYYPVYVANYKLGGASLAGIFNMIIREQKGFTYGASSVITGSKYYGIYRASSRVRTNATLESVEIFRNEMEKYNKEMPQDYIDFTKIGLTRANTRRFETLGGLMGMLNDIGAYGLATDYIKGEEAYLEGLTPEKQLDIVRKYINPAKMYYVVVGDAASQLKELEKAGLGKPILIKN